MYIGHDYTTYAISGYDWEILVGVINIIPMIGAYIGGAIGMFMVFTVSPIMSLWFLLYLCILQQIESNVTFLAT